MVNRKIEREDRIIPKDSVDLIVKNSRLRFSCFWLRLRNISAHGLGISYSGKGILPLRIGDQVDVTLDVHSKIFSRPIHVTGEIVHDEGLCRQEAEDEIILGIKIIEVERLHNEAWEEGVRKFQKVS